MEAARSVKKLEIDEALEAAWDSLIPEVDNELDRIGSYLHSIANSLFVIACCQAGRANG